MGKLNGDDRGRVTGVRGVEPEHHVGALGDVTHG